MTDPIDPFATRTPRPHALPPSKDPVRWQVRHDAYWVTDGNVFHPLRAMPLPRAQALLAWLNEQAENDLVAAFRDLPMLTALRRHVDRLERR